MLFGRGVVLSSSGPSLWLLCYDCQHTLTGDVGQKQLRCQRFSVLVYLLWALVTRATGSATKLLFKMEASLRYEGKCVLRPQWCPVFPSSFVGWGGIFIKNIKLTPFWRWQAHVTTSQISAVVAVIVSGLSNQITSVKPEPKFAQSGCFRIYTVKRCTVQRSRTIHTGVWNIYCTRIFYPSLAFPLKEPATFPSVPLFEPSETLFIIFVT